MKTPVNLSAPLNLNSKGQPRPGRANQRRCRECGSDISMEAVVEWVKAGRHPRHIRCGGGSCLKMYRPDETEAAE